jgi:ParB family chromosome partitioning protein
VIIPRPDKELHRQVLVANLHRENLNGLDVAEALIKELYAVTGLETKKITTALNTALVRVRRSEKHEELIELITKPLSVQRKQIEEFDLNETEKDIIGTLLGLRLNPYSINTMTFKILEFPEDLKKAIRDDGLPTTHATCIARIHASAFLDEDDALSLRGQCVTEVLSRRLSVSETKKLVGTLLPKKERTPSAISFAQKISPEGLSEPERKALVKLLKEKIKELQT